MTASTRANGLLALASVECALNRVKIKNYKRIGRCGVALKPLTVLVGRNGSGQSNFLDALRFVVDGLRITLDHAIESRSGIIDEVRRRSTEHPRNFALTLEMNLAGFCSATHDLEIAASRKGGFTIKQERLNINGPNGLIRGFYRIEDGNRTQSSVKIMPPVAPDRPYLVNAAGLPEFRETYDALLGMGFHNLNPNAMKALQSPGAGEILRRDGGNIASVVARIAADRPMVMSRIKSYLATIVPWITDVQRASLGPMETLEFRQKVVGLRFPWKFYAPSMSDGTLRALGSLVAVTQLAEGAVPVRLVGIEEPEAALHPAVSSAPIDKLREAAEHIQILVTTHSPDLLDQADPETDLSSPCKSGEETRKSVLWTPRAVMRLISTFTRRANSYAWTNWSPTKRISSVRNRLECSQTPGNHDESSSSCSDR